MLEYRKFFESSKSIVQLGNPLPLIAEDIPAGLYLTLGYLVGAAMSSATAMRVAEGNTQVAIEDGISAAVILGASYVLTTWRNRRRNYT